MLDPENEVPDVAQPSMAIRLTPGGSSVPPLDWLRTYLKWR